MFVLFPRSLERQKIRRRETQNKKAKGLFFDGSLPLFTPNKIKTRLAVGLGWCPPRWGMLSTLFLNTNTAWRGDETSSSFSLAGANPPKSIWRLPHCVYLTFISQGSAWDWEMPFKKSNKIELQDNLRGCRQTKHVWQNIWKVYPKTLIRLMLNQYIDKGQIDKLFRKLVYV